MSETTDSVDLTYEGVVHRIEALDRTQVSVGVLGTVLDTRSVR
jgi:hypothetical protein